MLLVMKAPRHRCRVMRIELRLVTNVEKQVTYDGFILENQHIFWLPIRLLEYVSMEFLKTFSARVPEKHFAIEPYVEKRWQLGRPVLHDIFTFVPCRIK